MLVLELNMYYTAAISALVLAVGILAVRKFESLQRYCIPAAVVGGVLFSLCHLVLHSAGILEITFDTELQTLLMIIFFCSVGFMASFRMLKKGGKLVIILLLAATLIALSQNIIGVSLSSLFGLDSRLGLSMGSISLMGGHGTSAAFGPLLENTYGVHGATAVAIASATFGLAISGVIGGPLARKRIEKHELRPKYEDVIDAQGYGHHEACGPQIDQNRFLYAIMLIFATIGAGMIIYTGLESLGVILPIYIGSMLVAMAIRNVADTAKINVPSKEIDTFGWISLSLFLTMALMNMKLWQIADLAAPMIIILAVQVIFVALFAYYVMFHITGKNYDAAAVVTATGGLGLGTTSNAMVNMDSLFAKYGVAPKVYLAVPLVGSVFIDIINAGMIMGFLYIL